MAQAARFTSSTPSGGNLPPGAKAAETRVPTAALAPVKMRVHQDSPASTVPSTAPAIPNPVATGRAALVGMLSAQLQDLTVQLQQVSQHLQGASPDQAVGLKQREADLEQQRHAVRSALAQTDQWGQMASPSPSFDRTVRELLGPALDVLAGTGPVTEPTGQVDRRA